MLVNPKECPFRGASAFRGKSGLGAGSVLVLEDPAQRRLGDGADDAAGDTARPGLTLRSGGHFLFMLAALHFRIQIGAGKKDVGVVGHVPDSAENEQGPDQPRIIPASTG